MVGSMNSGGEANTTGRLVGPEAVADYLNVSRNTVLNWARAGKIPCLRIEKIYRFNRAEILNFFATRQSNGMKSN